MVAGWLGGWCSLLVARRKQLRRRRPRRNGGDQDAAAVAAAPTTCWPAPGSCQAALHVPVCRPGSHQSEFSRSHSQSVRIGWGYRRSPSSMSHHTRPKPLPASPSVSFFPVFFFYISSFYLLGSHHCVCASGPLEKYTSQSSIGAYSSGSALSHFVGSSFCILLLIRISHCISFDRVIPKRSRPISIRSPVANFFGKVSWKEASVHGPRWNNWMPYSFIRREARDLSRPPAFFRPCWPHF